MDGPLAGWYADVLLVGYSHGICARCYAAEMAKLDAQRAGKRADKAAGTDG